MKFEILEKKEVDAKFLSAECGVRYWEDGNVNGLEDNDGDLIPCRDIDTWVPVIDLETGVIENWPQGTSASVHYKVCDAGIYRLLDGDRNVLATLDGYVISMMCPEGGGYGDYIIMNIDETGTIAKWSADLSPFVGDEQ